jgi:hypothetical protein
VRRQTEFLLALLDNGWEARAEIACKGELRITTHGLQSLVERHGWEEAERIVRVYGSHNNDLYDEYIRKYT